MYRNTITCTLTLTHAFVFAIFCGCSAPSGSTDDNPTAVEPQNEEPVEPNIKVTITGVNEEVGVYSCGLFDNEQSFTERNNPVTSTTIKVTLEPVVWTVKDVQPGEYAIAVFHDANENGKLDRHVLGYPTERYGFSNNARGKLGPPSYESVRFTVGSELVNQDIQVK